MRSSYLLAVAEEEIWRVWGTTRLISCRGGKYFLLFFASHFMPPVVRWEYFFYNFLHLTSCQMSRGGYFLLFFCIPLHASSRQEGDIFYYFFASNFMIVVKRGIFLLFCIPLHASCQGGIFLLFFCIPIHASSCQGGIFLIFFLAF